MFYLPPAPTIKRGCRSTLFLQVFPACPGIGSLVFCVWPALDPCIGIQFKKQKHRT